MCIYNNLIQYAEVYKNIFPLITGISLQNNFFASNRINNQEAKKSKLALLA